MLIYRIFEALGNLPVVPRILLIILVLVLLNGALVLALFKLDAYELFGYSGGICACADRICYGEHLLYQLGDP